MRAASATPEMIQNSGRHASCSACRPPMVGPRATAPKMHMFMIMPVIFSLLAGKPSDSGGTAAISSMLVQRPWRIWPAKCSSMVGAAAASTEPITSSTDVAEHHPPLGQSLRERHREHGADRVGGVGQARAEGQGLGAGVEVVADDRGDRSHRRGEREVGDQRGHDHRGHGGVATREGALAQHQRAL